MLIDFIEIQEDVPTIFDVGCFIDPHGTDFTGLCLERWEKANVYAFDPINFKEYETTYASLDNVRLSKVALDESRGKKSITFTPALRGLTSFYDRPAFLQFGLERRTVEISCDTVDEICQKNEIDKIDILKIDTEGAEMRVLRGARSMLDERKINYIYTECGGCAADAGYTKNDLCSFLRDYGFEIVSESDEDILFRGSHVSKE